MYAVVVFISAISLPLSRTSISARDFECSATRSPSRRSRAPRFDAVSFGHSPDVNALWAAFTARSTSSAVQRGISAQGLPVYGLSVSKNWPEAESVQPPPITVWYLVSEAIYFGCSVHLQVDVRLKADTTAAGAPPPPDRPRGRR